MVFNCLKARATSRYSFYQPQKDERLGQHWSHPVVLNMRPLDWESNALTTGPLFHYAMSLLKEAFNFINMEFNCLAFIVYLKLNIKN